MSMNYTEGIAPHSMVIVAPETDSHSIDVDEIKEYLVDVLSDPKIPEAPPAYPTPRKLFHRKNTIIRLWRMIAPKYENVSFMHIRRWIFFV